MILKGTFTSVWDDGFEIDTPAELDDETGNVFTQPVYVDGVDILDREYFTDENGKEYDICPVCHEYILKTEMVERTGKQLIERTGCTDENCDNTIEQY